MGWFRVKDAYYHTRMDALVLTGEILEPKVEPGLFVDFPRGDHGPRRVPIADVTTVKYANDKPEAVCIVIDYRHIQKYWDWDPTRFEGKLLEVVG